MVSLAEGKGFLAVVNGALVVVGLLLDCGRLTGLSFESLQKSELQRQANIVPVPSSVISLCSQSGLGTKGSDIEPSSTRVGKHSRRVAVSVGDFFHVYIRHASSLRHV